MDLRLRDHEILYASAYRFYEEGAYQKAAELFIALVMYDPFEARFWKGLAATRQMQKKYPEALHAWGVLALLDGHIPQTHFHAAECLLSQGEQAEALKALNIASATLSDKDPDLRRKISHLQQELAYAHS